MQTLNGRSYQRGETTLGELLTLTAGFAYADTLLDDDLLGSDYDAVVVDGDLHLPSLHLGDALVFLVVTGNLSVDGACVDCDDPATALYVLGNMQAGSVYTTGMLGVQGNLTVARTLAGSYNDYSAIVRGTTRAAVFYPENHFFEFGGEPAFGHLLGEAASHRVPTRWASSMKETLLGRALMDRSPCAEGEEVPNFSADDIESYGATALLDRDSLYALVREDRPVLND